jgi:pimeloyl-ACP methyl ester carboxylesterase
MLVQGVALSLLLASGAQAAASSPIADNPALPEACYGESVRTVSLDTHGRLFSYRYAYRPAEDPSMPVVINIPGGPGQGSIGMPLSLPYEFGIVRTDPLGAGCNANASLHADEITSEDIADGVLAAVREIRPKHYILYGASYGTIVATIAAAKASKAGLPPPDAVVLEGVIGRAYTPQESLQGFLKGWERLKAQLPAGAAQALSEEKPPLGFAPEIWGGWLQQLQLYGASPGGGPGFAVTVLSGLDPSAPEAGREVIRNQLRLFAQPADAAHVDLYRAIACREIDGATRGQKTDMALRGGQLVPLAAGFCGDRTMTRPFDAANYQITAPIFYFSGGWDPATPEFQARYHYDSQATARKTWVRVPTGSHLSFTGNLMDCQNALWKDIAATSGAHFPELLQSCNIRPAPLVFPGQ